MWPFRKKPVLESGEAMPEPTCYMCEGGDKPWKRDDGEWRHDYEDDAGLDTEECLAPPAGATARLKIESQKLTTKPAVAQIPGNVNDKEIEEEKTQCS